MWQADACFTEDYIRVLTTRSIIPVTGHSQRGGEGPESPVGADEDVECWASPLGYGT